MRSFFAVFSFSVWLVTLPSANGAQSNICCKTAKECAELTRDSALTRDSSYSETLNAYRLLTSGTWYLTEKNGSRIIDGSIGSWVLTKKDLAGSYTFSTSNMKVLNRWYQDPEIGLTKSGATTKNISAVCFEPNKLLVKVEGSNFVISSQLKEIQIEAAKNSGLASNKIRKALEVTTDYGVYLFSYEPTRAAQNLSPERNTNPERAKPVPSRGVASFFW